MIPAELAAKVAQGKREQLARLQPVRREARARAEELYRQRAGEQKAGTLRLETHKMLDCNIPGLFPTPPDLAARMVVLADIGPGMLVCEPEAGTGNIAGAIRAAGFEPVCVEYNYSLADLLRQQGYNVMCADFLEYTGMADRFVMNPPFENHQDAQHIRHAYDLTKTCGRIVAIVGESTMTGHTRKAREFQEWLDRIGAQVERLPGETFKTSRTMARAWLVVIDKED